MLAIATFGYASATKAGWLPKVALAWSTADSVIGAIQKDWIATEQALFDLFE